MIAIEATFEAGDFLGLIGIAAVAAWVVLMVGGARAIGLPGGRGHPEAETFPRLSLAIAAGIFIAGPAAAAIQLGYADPVAAEVMPGSASSLGGGLISIVTVSSVLPVVTLLIPLLLLAILLWVSAPSSVASFKICFVLKKEEKINPKTNWGNMRESARIEIAVTLVPVRIWIVVTSKIDIMNRIMYATNEDLNDFLI